MKLTAYITLLLVTTTLINAAPSKKLKKLTILSNPNYKPDAEKAFAKAKAKYGKYLNDNTKVASFSTGTIPMTDYSNDLAYYGTVQVGNPPQNLKLNFDTGSSDLWFASTLCTNCGSSQTKYSSNQSTTFQDEGKSWSIKYADGSTASGVTGIDTISLGGLSIKNQRIELAKSVTGSFQNDPYDGLLGLGFNKIASVASTKTPVDNLIEQGLVTDPIYGIYLGKASNGGGGELVFGGYNSNHVAGSFTTVPVNNTQGLWTIDIDGFSLGTGATSTPFSGIVDTGTSLLLLADPVASKIGTSLGGQLVLQGLYTIPCSNTNDLNLIIGGTKFTIPATDLIYAQSGSVCFSSVAASGSSTISILGDTFLKNVYTVFNQQVPQVQFAKVK